MDAFLSLSFTNNLIKNHGRELEKKSNLDGPFKNSNFTFQLENGNKVSITSLTRTKLPYLKAS